MQKFFIRARAQDGAMVREQIEAGTLKEAKRLVYERGLILIEASTHKPTWQNFFKSTRVSAADFLTFNRQFQIVYGVGVPIVRGLELVESQTANPVLREALGQIRADVSNGRALYESFARFPKIFDRTYVNLLRVGEASGKLDQVLDRISKFSEERVANQARVKSATLYPKIVIAVFTVVLFVLVYFVIPKIKLFFDQFKADLPLPTQIMLGISHMFVEYWYLIIASIGGVIFAYQQFVSSPRGRGFVDSFLLRLPIVGRIITELQAKYFCSTLELLLIGGIPILEALKLTRESLTNSLFQRQVDECIVSVDNGGRIAEVLARKPLFPVLLTGLVAVGEETGELDRVLRQIGSYYQAQLNHRLENLSKTLEPILLGLIFAGVLLMALAVYLPLWKMASVIKR